MLNPHQDTDYTRLAIALFLAVMLLLTWQAYIDKPRREQLAAHVKARTVAEEKKRIESTQAIASDKAAVPEENPNLTHTERLALSPRIAIRSQTLHGSIALKGARFDDLTLAKYRAELDPKSPEVTLLSPLGDKDPYLVQVGWVSADGKTVVPDQNTLWQADKKTLAEGETLTLRWPNGNGVTFILSVALDADYMFTITQRVENAGSDPVSVMPYAYINRAFADITQHYGILHEGPLGTMEGSLSEVTYKDLREKGKLFEQASGWLGITDKYWLTALIPGESGFKASFSHYTHHARDHYQVDYLGSAATIAAGSTADTNVRLFAGAKEITALDRYAAGDHAKNIAPIPLFDRAVDFGSLYFLTKPMFLMLTFFYAIIGNFGIAILLLTIVVKALMFPLANKSYHSMAQMRAIQPQMLKIRERYADDQIALNKEMMALYKREKVNPAAGCLPLLIQMPVFFALYKVLYVTIEMRHAPFFGWLKDLSAVDPSNLFTVFGLLPWDHPASLHVGILPILFCATMVIQMKQQPKPADPVQAKVMGFMPYFFLYLFASFPAGLVLYWTWSNVLSILQQQIIIRHHNAKEYRKANHG